MSAGSQSDSSFRPAAAGAHPAPEDSNEATVGAMRVSEEPTSAGSPGASASFAPGAEVFVGYDLQGEVHRGAQGVVYRAVQRSTRREVAIKVMREGPFAGPADKARFDREIQILGQLRHPNIVTVHESGAAAGCHYFAMDYIDGQPLDGHMRRRKLDIPQTLRLFSTICDAVNAAHLRGVIHRDLKPSNIRVDGSGAPHVLDFGLAKLDAGNPDAQVMTQTGQFIGSLPWAAPEQAEGSPGKIDTRTDVYALGVILYQMLTGRFPYDVVGGMHDVLDRILHADPVRPGTLRRGVNSEIDTIVLKCLHKERDRRYQTAGELRRDVERYLHGEPIEAKRDSLLYVLAKQAQKYWVSASLASAALLLLVVGVFVFLSLWQTAEGQKRVAQAALNREAAERRRAEGALAEAETARHREAEQRSRAEESAAKALREAAKLEAANKFLADILLAVSPENARGREITVREVLDEAAARLDAGALRSEPLVEAAVLDSLGKSYLGLGLLDQAEERSRQRLRILDRAGGERLALLEAQADLATVLRERNKGDEAERMIRAAVEELREFESAAPRTLSSVLNTYAVILQDRNALGEAEALFREAMAIDDATLPPDHPDRADLLNNLGFLLQVKGDLPAAERLLRQSLELVRKHEGEDHPHFIISLSNLAMLRFDQKDSQEALRMLAEALAGAEAVLGPAHPVTAGLAQNLGFVHADRGELANAATAYAQALEIWERHHPDQLSNIATLIDRLGEIAQRQGDASAAIARYREAMAIYRKAGDDQAAEAVAKVLGQLAGSVAESQPATGRP